MDKDKVELLTSTSMGHPYLMQLHGYYLLSVVNDQTNDRSYAVTNRELEALTPNKPEPILACSR